jgi:exodeoxyribonuclease VII small subunit
VNRFSAIAKRYCRFSGLNHFPHWDFIDHFYGSYALKRLDSRREEVHYNRRRSETPLAKFEECLQRLEKIVQELEKGEVPLEKSLTLFEEGMQLSSSCRKELEQAEGKVEILLKKNGKLQAEPFEALTEKSPARR